MAAIAASKTMAAGSKATAVRMEDDDGGLEGCGGDDGRLVFVANNFIFHEVLERLNVLHQ
jgi:hypothetical protein